MNSKCNSNFINCNLNDLQNKLVSMLDIFASSCEKFGLKYFLYRGTLLGSIKYKKMIPWDDDIDIIMPRQDYNFLLKNYKKMFDNNFYIECFSNTKGYFLPFAKFIDLNTTAIEVEFKDNLNMKHGVWLDIIPYDFSTKTKFNKFDSFVLTVLRHRIYNDVKKGDKFIIKLERAFGHLLPRERAFVKYDNFFVKRKKTKNKSIVISDVFKTILPLEYFETTSVGEFNGKKYVIPANYNELLTYFYNNWKLDPPPEKKVSHHHFYIIDTTKPFKEYFKYEDINY